MPKFRINHFEIESEILLPCWQPTEIPESPDQPIANLSIRRRQLGDLEYEQVDLIGRRYGGDYLRSYDTGGGVLICAGSEVQMLIPKSADTIFLDFDATDSTAVGLAGLLAVNLGLSVVTLLRGEIPLHASAVAIQNRIVAFIAPSGTGKSTLLWYLLHHGAQFVTDDVLPLYSRGPIPFAVPSISLAAKVTGSVDSIIHNTDLKCYPVLPGADEYWIPLPSSQRCLKSFPLSALYVLTPSRPTKLTKGKVLVNRISAEVAPSYVLPNIQGLWAVRNCIDGRRLFKHLQELSTSVPVFTLEYLRDPSILAVLMNIVQKQ